MIETFERLLLTAKLALEEARQYAEDNAELREDLRNVEDELGVIHRRFLKGKYGTR